MSSDGTLNTHDLLFWVGELQMGRPNAAEPTFRKILAKVELFARNMFAKYPRVGRFVDVEDVIQNSLIRLLAAFREIRPTSTRHFYALVNEFIRRELLDLAKSYFGPQGAGTRLVATAVGEGEGEIAPPIAPPDADLEASAAFHEAIEQLPVEQREVIGLSYYHGWTQDDIANLFQVNVRTVQRWLQDAQGALKDRLPSH